MAEAQGIGEEKEVRKQSRRLLCFPLPVQGHVTPMLHLATLLHSEGFSITIIQTRYNSIEPSLFPKFTFRFVEDGLSKKSESLPSDPSVVPHALNKICLEPFRVCLSRILKEDVMDKEPVPCLITDQMWLFTGNIADSFNLPRMTLRILNISYLQVTTSLQLLQRKGYFPIPETKLDDPVLELPPLRFKDLPPQQFHDQILASFKMAKSSKGIICNSFEDLEGSALAKVGQALPIPVFPVGPLQKFSINSAGSIRAQDPTSLHWLDKQAPSSVLYISFGSLAVMTEAEFVEVAWGIANSEQPFLWVLRPGIIQGLGEGDHVPFPDGFLDTVSDRGKIVKWAPQQEVLAHPAIGGFWTHSGWNSTLESISEGVPMICLLFFGDQPHTARLVNDDWRIGFLLEKVSRKEVERQIIRLMVEEEGKEMRNNVMNLKKKASLSVLEGGSSYKSRKRLTSYLLSL